MVKLSKTGKLDGILSWSLQARDTCPGSIGANGELVAACKGCYATAGNYHYASVKAPREHNRGDWQRDTWVSDMVAALDNSRYFRWFDSGDVYALGLAEKIYQVMQQTPHVSHWLPTRMAKFPKFKKILAAMQALPNVMVRFSSDSVMGEYTKGLHGSTIVPTADDAPSESFICGAYERDGKCKGCRACYDKNVPLIAYVAHGRSMAKVVRIYKAKG